MSTWSRSCAGCVVALTLAPSTAVAAPPRYEPTDLELETPGEIQIDMQVGATSGSGSGRLLTPDFEVDIGLLPRVELGIDTSLGFEPLTGGVGRFVEAEPVWASAKIVLADDRGPERAVGWGLGLQLGPRFGLTSAFRGVGYQGILLAGIYPGRAHVVLNAGAFVDPSGGASRTRPVAVLAGIDVDIDLDARGRWSLISEVGTSVYITQFPSDLATALGLAWNPSKAIEVSLLALATPVGPRDTFGALLGFAPRFAAF